jgi:tetratricopeptide (TPR) repeat protein
MKTDTTAPLEHTHKKNGLDARDLLVAAFAFTVSLVVYVSTLAPTITFGDSGELVTAAVTLGVAHPPGYPLWLLLAKVFSLLPIGSTAYRANLMSAICGAAAVGALTLVISRTIPRMCARMIPTDSTEFRLAARGTRWAAPAAALFLAFSPTFWQQSIIAEVYALNNLLFCVILLLLALWGEAPEKNILLYLAAFLFGAGQANHQTLVLMAPAILLYVILIRPRAITSVRLVARCLILFSLGLCFYLYLPLRASSNPPLNWGNPATWESFWFHVLRKQYRSVQVVRPLTVLLPQLKFFFVSVARESAAMILLPPALLAIVFADKNGKKWLLFTGTIFVCTGVFLVVLANTELDLNAQDILKIYFLPPLIVVAIWIGYGLAFISLLALRSLLPLKAANYIRRNDKVAAGLAGGTILLLALPAVNLHMNYRLTSMRGHGFGALYGDMLMKSLKERAILLSGTDSAYAIPMYMKWVEGKRADIAILSVNRLADPNYLAEAERNAPDLSFLTPQDYSEAFSRYNVAGNMGNGGLHGAHAIMRINGYLISKLLERNISARPMYYDEGVPIDWIHDFTIPSGLVMELSGKRVESLSPETVLADTAFWDSIEKKLLENDEFEADTAARQKFSKCRSNIGALYVHRRMYSEAEAALRQAIRISGRNIEAYALLAVMYRQQGKYEKSVRIFDEYLRLDPWNTSAREFARSLRQ